MTTTQSLITMAVIVLATVLTRFLPFMIFPAGHKTPPFVQYLGKCLPPAVFSLLLVYCLKDMNAATASGFFPAAMGVLATVLLHVWKREMMLSIAGGTFLYMLLIRLMA